MAVNPASQHAMAAQGTGRIGRPVFDAPVLNHQGMNPRTAERMRTEARIIAENQARQQRQRLMPAAPGSVWPQAQQVNPHASHLSHPQPHGLEP